MNRTEFQQMVQQDFEKILGLNDTKGHDYAGDEDALKNFKYDAKRIKKIAANDPVLAKWYVYFSKHLDAIFTYLEEGDVKSEPIEGRIHDCILYLFLLLGLHRERLGYQRPITDADPDTTQEMPVPVRTNVGRNLK
jgi:hypothetical protein